MLAQPSLTTKLSPRHFSLAECRVILSGENPVVIYRQVVRLQPSSAVSELVCELHRVEFDVSVVNFTSKVRDNTSCKIAKSISSQISYCLPLSIKKSPQAVRPKDLKTLSIITLLGTDHRASRRCAQSPWRNPRDGRQTCSCHRL